MFAKKSFGQKRSQCFAETRREMGPGQADFNFVGVLQKISAKPTELWRIEIRQVFPNCAFYSCVPPQIISAKQNRCGDRFSKYLSQTKLLLWSQSVLSSHSNSLRKRQTDRQTQRQTQTQQQTQTQTQTQTKTQIQTQIQIQTHTRNTNTNKKYQ